MLGCRDVETIRVEEPAKLVFSPLDIFRPEILHGELTDDVVSIERPKIATLYHVSVDRQELIDRLGSLDRTQSTLVVLRELTVDEISATFPSHSLRNTALLTFDDFLEACLGEILDVVHLLDHDVLATHLVSDRTRRA